MQYTQNTNQLSIDFSETKKEEIYRPRLASRNHPVYHKEASSILNDRFNIKISYEWRSYLISWFYRIQKFKNFYASDFSWNEISSLKIEKVMHFQNNFYIRSFLTKKEEYRFQKIVENIISDFKNNPNLEIK
ncbi:MAG: hypothetical protein ACD_4C00409G0001 [uncultured bacterium (gcode 4)]|uniref:Uncharacterized protein n=1 Tax=uncultured bacterium (gcode 4) TaxID=1234023 RepID=K2F524_9BACT|nr:MAG: hypothetical protein ACD_4C00409G0001 [uncultured bacterium (gcode 4)]